MSSCGPRMAEIILEPVTSAGYALHYHTSLAVRSLIAILPLPLREHDLQEQQAEVDRVPTSHGEAHKVAQEKIANVLLKRKARCLQERRGWRGSVTIPHVLTGATEPQDAIAGTCRIRTIDAGAIDEVTTHLLYMVSSVGRLAAANATASERTEPNFSDMLYALNELHRERTNKTLSRIVLQNTTMPIQRHMVAALSTYYNRTVAKSGNKPNIPNLEQHPISAGAARDCLETPMIPTTRDLRNMRQFSGSSVNEEVILSSAIRVFHLLSTDIAFGVLCYMAVEGLDRSHDNLTTGEDGSLFNGASGDEREDDLSKWGLSADQSASASGAVAPLTQESDTRRAEFRKHQDESLGLILGTLIGHRTSSVALLCKRLELMLEGRSYFGVAVGQVANEVVRSPLMDQDRKASITDCEAVDPLEIFVKEYGVINPKLAYRIRVTAYIITSHIFPYIVGYLHEQLAGTRLKMAMGSFLPRTSEIPSALNYSSFLQRLSQRSGTAGYDDQGKSYKPRETKVLSGFGPMLNQVNDGKATDVIDPLSMVGDAECFYASTDSSFPGVITQVEPGGSITNFIAGREVASKEAGEVAQLFRGESTQTEANYISFRRSTPPTAISRTVAAISETKSQQGVHGFDTFCLADAALVGPSYVPTYSPRMPPINVFGMRLLMKNADAARTKMTIAWAAWHDASTDDR